LGRVVKNARLGAQKYQVAVPTIEHNGTVEDSSFIVSPQPESDPIEYTPLPVSIPVDDVAREAAALIDRAEEKAKALLADAHERARALIEDAAARGEELVAAVRSQAHTEGYAAATAAADREMNEMMATMRNLVEMARAERHKLVETAEPELVRLAMGIAERVLHQQIALDRGVVVEMAKVAIARLVERESVTVRINPGDLERMRQHRDDFLNSGEIKHLRFIEDQRVDRGGVVVETDGGTIDARLGTQLAEAKRVLHIEDEVVVQPADARESNLRAARAS
jgi:flagellar assembly protein FliH